MLISIAGSQGSGKSTLLKALKENGYNVIERKTSRSILSDWNVSLQEVNCDPALTIRFQDEITTRKYQDEAGAMESDEIWFTERTHSDLFSYALISLGKDNEYSDWLDNYFNVCRSYNRSYNHVFYLTAGHFDVVADGVRGASDHYSRMVDLTMLDFTTRMVDNNLHVITVPELGSRVKQIIDIVEG